ncbi:MAG: GNAT family N-acetyltransferase [bacterium]
MQLHKIISSETEKISKILDIYVDSFPEEERRPVPQWLDILKYNTNFTLYGVMIDGDAVGFLTAWEVMPEIIYIEHFAISSTMRGKSIGSEVMREFIAIKENSTIILEVEEPTLALCDIEKKIRKSRIKFYEKLGFKLQNLDYFQPSYHNDSNTMILRLMTNSEEVLINNYNTIRNNIYRDVYNYTPTEI